MKMICKQVIVLMRFINLMILEKKKYFFIAFFAGLTAIFLNLLLAYMLKGIYTAVSLQNLPLLYKSTCFFLLSVAGIFLYNYIFWHLHASAVIKITGNIRRLIISKLCSLRMYDLEKYHSGEIMSLLTNDLNDSQGVYFNIRFIISSILLGLVSTVFVFNISGVLGIVIILLALLQLFVNLLVIKPLESQSAKIRSYATKTSSTFSDVLRNNKTLRLCCSRDFYIDMSRDINKSLYRARMKLNNINTIIEGINVFLGLWGYITILLIGNLLIDSSKLNLPDLLFITQMRIMMVQGIATFGNYAVQIQPAILGGNKILSFMDCDIEDNI